MLKSLEAWVANPSATRVLRSGVLRSALERARVIMLEVPVSINMFLRLGTESWWMTLKVSVAVA